MSECLLDQRHIHLADQVARARVFEYVNESAIIWQPGILGARLEDPEHLRP